MFTGVLGTKYSKPGNIELGTVLPAGTVIDHVSVSDSVSLTIEMHYWQRMYESVVVTDQIQKSSDIVRTVTDNVSVTDTITFDIGTTIHVTQSVLEYLGLGTPSIYITQDIVEVLYKTGKSFIITDNVIVSESIDGRGRSVPITVTDNVTTADTRTARSDISHQTITDNVHTDDTITIVRHILTVTDHVTVSDSIIRAGDRNLTLSDYVSVTDQRFGRNTNVRITITDSITSNDSGANVGQVLDTVTDSTHITENIRYSPISKIITHVINVYEEVFEGIVNRNLVVSDLVYVTSYFIADNNYRTVTDNVHVSQSITTANSRPRLTITDNVTVRATILGGSSSRQVTVTDAARISDRVGAIATFVFQTITDTVTVTDSIRRNNISVLVTFTDNVRVKDYFPGPIFITLFDYVTVSEYFSGPRPITIIDTVVAYDVIRSGNSNRIITVRDTVAIFDYALWHGVHNIIEETIRENIIVNERLDHSPNSESISDSVQVAEHINFDIKHLKFFITDNVIVGEWLHQNINNQTVTDNVGVSSKILQYDWAFHDHVTVTDAIHLTHDFNFTDSLTIDETLTKSRDRLIHFEDDLVIGQIVDRTLWATRTFVDRLTIGPDYRFISDPMIGTVSVPALQATIMGAIPSVYMYSQSGQVILPPPEFGDTDSHTGTVNLMRGTTGSTIAIVKSSQRQTFKWAFTIGRLKAFELRAWLVKSLSQVITIIDWNGVRWVGRITSNPFTLDFQGRWEKEVEKIVVDLEFQMVRAS